MGRIITPMYRVEYRDNLLTFKKTNADCMGACGKPVLTMCWQGRVSDKRLRDWREVMNLSFNENGSNHHITKSYGIIPHIFYCAIIRQSDKKIMCEYMAPAFEVA